MDSSNLFAVVDIETTGTNQEKDKIIQFACVIIENQQIVNQISIDINPLRSIPKNISELTGITNKDVTNAPYFEDVASTIKNLIEDCVFVAHNVFFDYNFLNSELIRSGLNPLKLKCVDTVELFQILFPMSEGFRVSDMANELELTHENPHQAISDAMVTAQGFIQMLNKINSLPLVTLKKLVDLSGELGVDNSDVFKMILSKKNKSGVHQELQNFIVIGDLALRKKDRSYRYSTNDMNQEFNANSEFLRLSQKEMTQDIFTFINESKFQKNLLVEAETGTGKTLGYLYPLSYIDSNFPVLISTSTILLQNQLLNQDIPFLNKIAHMNKQGVIVKSPSHYLNLEYFVQTLENPVLQKNYAICQMAVLVWLLETQTGDLDEINVGKNNLFYQQVSHSGIKGLENSSIFFEEDFINYVIDKCRFADFIIVNHSFLFSDSQKEHRFLPDFDVVVMDEAHQLPTLLEELAIKNLPLYELLHQINQLIELSSSVLEKKYDMMMFEGVLSELHESIDWIQQCLHNYYSRYSVDEILVDLNELYAEVPILKKSVQQSNILFRELSQLSDSIKNDFAKNNGLVEKDFLHLLNSILLHTEIYNDFFYDLDVIYTKWIKLTKSKLELSMINFSDLSLNQYKWYQNAQKVVYTSGSLQLDSQSTYFEEKLGLKQVEKKQLPAIFDYSKQAELFLLTDIQPELLKSTKDFAKKISKVVKSVFFKHQKTMLVLFTSHELLKAVHEKLTEYYSQQDVLILSQGISGTKEKIIKKINQGHKCIILGANSFWEGMDFSKQSIDIVLMTKLPFDPPNRPIVQARYHYIESQGHNPFYHDALPKTGIRLRQGIGRLLRSPNDKGVLIVLDDRLVNSQYSKNLREYLPRDLKIKLVNLPTLVEESYLFLENKSEGENI